MKLMAYQNFGGEIFGKSMQFCQICQNFPPYSADLEQGTVQDKVVDLEFSGKGEGTEIGNSCSK